MFSLFHKSVPFYGTVLFRGNLPPQKHEFGYLSNSDIAVSEIDPKGCNWALSLQHPLWGKATLRSLPQLSPFHEILECATMLTPKEKESIGTAGSELILEMPSSKNDILKDRKLGLRFLNEIMGNDGLAAVDCMASGFWPPDALKDELSHDADLDVAHIYFLHMVQNESGDCYWLHSHGLAEIGFFDFDILRPHPDIMNMRSDVLRAIAFGIIQNDILPNTKDFQLTTHGKVSFIPVSEFNSIPNSELVSIRDRDKHHDQNRSVICDFKSNFLGFSKRITNSKLLSSPIAEGDLLHFSKQASDFMRLRAKSTYKYFCQLHSEFSKLGLPSLVKLGYLVDGSKIDCEYLWFSVNGLSDTEIDATLECQPYRIARMKLGDRAKHPIELLTEWMIMTPFGTINANNNKVARYIKQDPEVQEKILSVTKNQNI